MDSRTARVTDDAVSEPAGIVANNLPVECYLTRVYTKIGVRRRSEAKAFAYAERADLAFW